MEMIDLKLRRARLALIPTALLILAAVPAPAGAGPVIARPDWIKGPADIDMAMYYPQKAYRLALSGDAVVRCAVTTEGRLTDCSVVSETPPDLEFGPTALRIASRLIMKPTGLDGQPTAGGQVTVAFRFDPPEGAGPVTLAPDPAGRPPLAIPAIPTKPPR